MDGKKLALGVFGILASLCLAGCGGSAAPISVAVTASAPTVDGADTTTITAMVTNDPDSKGVTWTVSGAGTLSASTTTSTTFTAPAATSSAQTATVTATSIANTAQTGSATITIPAKLSVTNSTPTALNGSVGATYSVQLQGSGGIPPYKNWALAAGNTLPACLTLNSSTGQITFTSAATEAACAAGSPYDPAFTFQDSGTPTPQSGTTPDYDITITNPSGTITLPGTAAAATAGVAYGGNVTAAGGAGALTYSVTAGATALTGAGFTLNSATGAITGTPTTVGSVSFTVAAMDAFGDAASQAYTLTINPGAATHFVVAATTSTTITAGNTVGLSVTAEDVDGNTATGYAGTVHFTSADTLAVLPANAGLTSGVGTFTATLKTAGVQAVTATDTVTSSISGTLSGITVNAGALSKIMATTPSPQTAGTAFNVTVTASDQYGNTITGNTDLIAITSTDTAAVLPSSAALAAGAKVFSVTLKTAGTQTVTATDATATLSGTTSNITVNAGAASKLVFATQPPSSVTAGVGFGAVVEVEDANGNLVTTSTATVGITSTAAGVTGTATVNAVNGVATFSGLTFNTVGSYTLAAASAGLTSATTTGSITVNAGSAFKLAFTIAPPSSVTAGAGFGAVVQVEDAEGNLITSSNALVTITSTASGVTGTTTVSAVNGIATFAGLTINTSGSYTLTAAAGGLTSGTSGSFTVVAGTVNNLVVSAASPEVAGTAFNVTVTAEDTYGNTVTGDTDTIQIMSSDGQAALPANAALVAGVKVFSVTLKTAGIQTVTARDTSTSLSGLSGSITLSAGTITQLEVSTGSSATAGTPFLVIVTAADAYGNVVAGYTGTVKITTTDSAAVLPANSTLTNGVGNFNVTFKTAGNQTIYATDTVNSSLTAASNAPGGGITVNPAVVNKLVVAAPANATTSAAFNFTVTAEDQYNNIITSFPDVVEFSGGGAGATLPANSALTNGTKQFSATLATNGNQTITAADVSNGSITGTSGQINVSTALIVTTSSLNPLDVGQTPTQVMAASGGSGVTADYSWSWTAQNGSSLPPGLTMGTNGAIGGSPTTAGTYNVAVKVTDSGSSTSNTANLSITIYGALSLPSASLPAGYTGVAYSGATIAATGGSGNYCYTVPTLLQYFGGIWDGLSSASPDLPSGGNCNYEGSSLFISGTPNSSPTPPYTISINMTVVDLTTGKTASRLYSISVTAPTAPMLPTPNPITLPSATVTQSYIGSINATDSVGSSFTWTINGSTTLTNGNSTSLGNGLTATANGDVLNIAGTPTTLTAVPFSALVTDNSDSLSSTAQSYSITVNPNGSTVSGTVSMGASCGTVTLPTFTISLYNGSTFVTSTQSNSSGGYSFTGVANGTYNIIPTAQTASSSLFSPAQYGSVVLNGSSVTGENFNAQVGFTVSGNVLYNSTGGTNSPGAQTGQVYLSLANNNCGGAQSGTSITTTALNSGGAFSIRGVPPGSYTLNAWMDVLGQGEVNITDPTGSTSGIILTNASATGTAVTIANATYSVPSSNPSISGVIPYPNGVLMPYDGSTTSGEENATQYIVEWSTSPAFSSGSGSSFSSVAGSHTFAATGTGTDIWILDNSVAGAGTFTSGGTYYFQARSINPAGHPSGWTTYGGSTPTAVIIAAPACSGCATVSGIVTIPAGTTIGTNAQLYAGYINNSTGQVVITQIGPPVVGANAFSVQVPTGSGWTPIAILDQNNDGVVDAGDLTILKEGNSATITISDNLSNQSITLPSAGSTANIQTVYLSSTQSNGSGGSNTSSSYELNMTVSETNKLPVAVTINAGPNLINSNPSVAIDLAASVSPGHVQFQYQPPPLLGTPTLADTYDFTVTYSDGSQDTGNTVNGVVTAFGSTGAVVGPSDLATNLAPAGTTSTSTTPTFTWTYPANASNYTYAFQLSNNSSCSGACNIWQIGDNSSSKVDGFTVAEDQASPFNGTTTTGSIPWADDPIPSDNSTPSPSILSVGTTYGWQFAVQDTNGNKATTSTWFQAGAVALPASSSNPLGQGVAGDGYGQQLNASGGEGGDNYSFVVNGTAIPTNGTATTVPNGDGLTFSSTGSDALFVRGTPITAETVYLTVEVIDTENASNNTTTTYSVTVGNGPDGSENSSLNGTYVCMIQGFIDSNGYAWDTLSSLVLNGSGSITSGVFDSNGVGQSLKTGTITGTYAVGSDNNGLATANLVYTGGSFASTYALSITGSSSPAQEFRMVESDDAGPSPSGSHSSADCYLATPSAFASSTLANNNFVHYRVGQGSGGVEKATVGRFVFGSSGALSSGYEDGVQGGSSSLGGGSITGGSYGTPNSATGRTTLSVVTSGGTSNFIIYLIDANRSFLMQSDTGEGVAGMMHKQQESSYSALNLSGPYAGYVQGINYATASGTTPSSYYSEVLQATGSGTGNLTVNQSYLDNNGSYSVGDLNGTGPLTFDNSNPGRFTIPSSDGGLNEAIYLYDTNSGFEIGTGANGPGGSANAVESGTLEPQTQTTFTDAAAEGNYMIGRPAAPNPGVQGRAGQFNLSSAGAISAGISSGWEGIFSYDQPFSYTYAFDSTATGTGSLQMSNGTSCVVISSTRIVCTAQSNGTPLLFMLQQ